MTKTCTESSRNGLTSTMTGRTEVDWLPMNPWGGGSDLWMFLGVFAFIVAGIGVLWEKLRNR